MLCRYFSAQELEGDGVPSPFVFICSFLSSKTIAPYDSSAPPLILLFPLVWRFYGSEWHRSVFIFKTACHCWGGCCVSALPPLPSRSTCPCQAWAALQGTPPRLSFRVRGFLSELFVFIWETFHPLPVLIEPLEIPLISFGNPLQMTKMSSWGPGFQIFCSVCLS